MQEENIILTHEIYAKHLAHIKGLEFTYREIDIIACLIHFEQSNEIAQFLYIDKRTVSTHIKNIKKTLQVDSTKQVLNFIKTSDKFTVFKNEYWPNLCARIIFEQILRKFSRTGRKENFYYEAYYQTHKNAELFVNQIKNHLKDAGLAVRKKIEKNHQPLSEIFPSVDEDTLYTIYLIPEDLGAIDKANHSTINLTTFVAEANKASGKLILLQPEGRQAKKVSRHLLFEKGEYYLSFFEILKELYPGYEIEKLILEFKKECKNLNDSAEMISSQSLIGYSTLGHENINSHRSKSFLKKRRRQLYTGVALLSCIIAVAFFIIQSNRGGEMQAASLSSSLQQSSSSVRSDLVLPKEAILLDRSELIDQLNNNFKGKDGIQTIAIVGIGGSGKTTLARQYAHKQKAKIIWEINAETEETLSKSFENLAHALAKTAGDKRALKEQLDIKNSRERESKIILFVKEHLNLYSNWLLIFDNVEQFSDIQKYFPCDSSTWGNGKIILTTRDSNIQYNNYVNSVVQLQELSPREKLKLFVKIMNNGGSLSFPRLQEVKKFLEKIPPFPLDVSIAAYYLKAMNVPPFKYLEYLDEQNIDFSNVQENILKEEGNYIETRYKIITLSLKQLINTKKDFCGLLLFLSLLNSQGIPRDLLARYKNDVLVDECIYNLKKYSFLTNESLSSPLGQTFSMHRSTQAIILAYLLKESHLEDDQKLLASIADTLESYIDDIVEEENYEKMKLFVTHPKIFLSHNNLWSESIKGSLESQIGILYYYLNYYGCAKERLEYSLITLNESDAENYTRISQTLGYLGSINRDLGHHEKARELLEQGLKIYQKHLSKNYKGIARTIKNLGNAHRSLDHREKATQLLEQSLEIYQKYLPNNYVAIASTLNYLGNAYRYLGEYEKAKETLEKSIRIYKEKLPENHLGMAWALSYLGNIYRLTGDYQKAKNLLEESLILFSKSSSGSIYEAWALTFLGNTYGEMGEHEKAKEALEKSVLIYRTRLPENQVGISWVLAYLGNIYQGLNNYQKAKNLLEGSLALYRKENFPGDHIYVVWASIFLGNVYRALGNHQEAKSLLEQSFTICKNRYGKNHTETASILENLGQVYLLEGNLKKAEIFLTEALDIFQEKKHPSAYKCLESFSALHLKQSEIAAGKGNMEEAYSLKGQALNDLTKALEIVKNHFPEDSPHIFRIQQKLLPLQKSEVRAHGSNKSYFNTHLRAFPHICPSIFS